MANKKLQIRNSTAEFLIFTSQAGENTIEVMVQDETVWLTQKMIAALFDSTKQNIGQHLSVGYRVNSQRATQFRQWATSVLRDFAIRGYVLDKERLKNGKTFGTQNNTQRLKLMYMKDWRFLSGLQRLNKKIKIPDTQANDNAGHTRYNPPNNQV